MEAWPLTGRPASDRDASPFTGSLYRKAEPLPVRLGLSQGGQTPYREAGNLIGRPGLLQGGKISHREAEPLTVRPGLSQ